MGQHFTVRKARRFSSQLSGLYMGEDFVGQAVVKDVSLTGWRMVGTYPVKRGTKLTLRIYLADDDTAIHIPEAVVRWSQGHEFGLELGPLPSPSWKRLRAWIGERAREIHDGPGFLVS